jgi:hypothetical protein
MTKIGGIIISLQDNSSTTNGKVSCSTFGVRFWIGIGVVKENIFDTKYVHYTLLISPWLKLFYDRVIM